MVITMNTFNPSTIPNIYVTLILESVPTSVYYTDEIGAYIFIPVYDIGVK